MLAIETPCKSTAILDFTRKLRLLLFVQSKMTMVYYLKPINIEHHHVVQPYITNHSILMSSLCFIKQFHFFFPFTTQLIFILFRFDIVTILLFVVQVYNEFRSTLFRFVRWFVVFFLAKSCRFTFFVLLLLLQLLVLLLLLLVFQFNRKEYLRCLRCPKQEVGVNSTIAFDTLLLELQIFQL